jgi:hypothetical protein
MHGPSVLLVIRRLGFFIVPPLAMPGILAVEARDVHSGRRGAALCFVSR